MAGRVIGRERAVVGKHGIPVAGDADVLAAQRATSEVSLKGGGWSGIEATLWSRHGTELLITP